MLQKLMCRGKLSFTGVVSVTLNFHPQGRNVNGVTNEEKVEKSEAGGGFTLWSLSSGECALYLISAYSVAWSHILSMTPCPLD